MAPNVFTPYTPPIDFSPTPATKSVLVMSGRVIPAQNEAGNMIARQMA